MFSLVIPTYNRPQLLRFALNSVQQQREVLWEALVVEDGNGEGLEVVAALADPRIKGYKNQGKGQVDARNTALQAAQGNWIVLLDDDDYLIDPTHLLKAQKILQTKDALLHRCGYLVKKQDGIDLKQTPFDRTATPESLRHDNTILVAGVTYPKAFHAQLGVFDPDMSDYWDWDWYLRVVGAGHELIQLHQHGVGVSVHGANVSYGHRFEQRQQLLDRLCQKHGLTGIDLKDHQIIAEE